ncbi:MAG: DUF1573 domain-containing protein [Muribaculaceae bacterium]|nr:DUF1573 domain-containing protein [Muribaculaceae bacterium]
MITLRIYCIILFLCSSVCIFANDNNGLEFTDTICDLGYLTVDGGNRIGYFECINRSNSSISIVGALSTCGCTVPTYPKSPIEPGQKGVITVSYDPAGRPIGEFEKILTIITTGSPREIKLYLRGETISIHSTTY